MWQSLKILLLNPGPWIFVAIIIFIGWLITKWIGPLN